jgi:phosphatidylinositol alpha-mannosyltransferase
MSLRICLVSSAYRPYPSGVSEHVYNLACALRELGHEVTILTTRFPAFESPDKESAEPAEVYRLGRAILVPLNRSYATLPVGLKLTAQVAQFFKRRQFDIVHCHGLFWPELSYWALRYSRSTNLITFLTAGFKIHTAGSSLFRLLFRSEIGKIHGRIAISRRARAAIEPYLPGEYRIIPSGINLNRFRPDLPPLPEPVPATPAPRMSRNKTILFLSRLDKRKGLDVLIRAMPLILKAIPDACLIVVGRGPMEGYCRELVKRLEIGAMVRFIGQVNQGEVPRYYCGADVFCSPALGGETQGVVLLEAMACGVPVVASRIPGYDETVRDRVDGILFPAGDIAGLAHSLIQVLTDESLKVRLVSNGRKKVLNYAWPVIAQQTLNYYQELLARRKQSLGQ